MTAFYVLRHPQTTWNHQERYQGRLNSPLSDEGKLQARVVGKAFERGGIDAVYSSPLTRAQDLARELARRTSAPLRIDYRLTEIGQGPWEGLHRNEIQRRFPHLYEQWYRAPETVRFPFGESLVDVQRRALSVLHDLFQRHPDSNVVLVTHSVVIQTMVSAGLALDLKHIHNLRIANCSVTTICGAEPPGSILSFNATDPLYGSPIASAAALECVGWRPRRIAS